MEGRRLAANVVLPHPETGTPVHFSEGMTVPGWAAALITNPECWAADGGLMPGGAVLVGERGPEFVAPLSGGTVIRPEDGGAGAAAVPSMPPKGGPGSGRDIWAAFAEQLGVNVEPEMSRDDIVAAVEAAGA